DLDAEPVGGAEANPASGGANVAAPPARDPTPTSGAAGAPTATAGPATATPLPPTPEPLSTVIPEVIEALPAGEIVLREDSVNRRIAERLVGRGPIEDASMHFVPDELQVDLVILGTTNQIRAGLAIAGGRVVVRDAVLTGPMALVVSVEDLIAPIEDQVNESLDVTGRNLLAVRVEPGQVVVTIE
ncbi:MAG: hypothetical protein HC822_07550, partial [Oscillochloris sp.]|nr:hypothetical protein [Oscillochloris sp.]